MADARAKTRGEIALPVLGEGYTLRFTNRGLLALQESFGADFVQRAYERITSFDLKFLEAAFDLAIHKDGAPAPLRFKDVDVPLTEIADNMLDAFYVSMFGRKFAEHLAWLQIESARKEGDGSGPPASPET